MLSLILTALIQAQSAPAVDCTSSQTVSAAMNTGGAALMKRDYPAAKSAVAAYLSCDPKTAAGAFARLLTAEAGASLGDWANTLRAVNELDVAHLPPRFYARVEFIRMGAYAAQHDATDFAAARTRLIAAENQALAKLGPLVERFEVGPYRVAAYKAPITQGGFNRIIEFLIEPTADFAIPQSVMLTDDKGTASLSALLGEKSGSPALKIYFVDMYNCTMHMTLKQVPAKDGAEPDYASVKGLVVEALSGKPSYSSGFAPGGDACRTSMWITPGLSH